MELDSIEIVEDRTSESRCDEGFLRLQRLRLRNRYRDGSLSEVYPCDVVSRRSVDAVVAVLYWFEETDRGRRAMVALRESLRPPVYLRRFKTFVVPDRGPYDTLLEVVAGLIEDVDAEGDDGLLRRAAIEALEEAGFPCSASDFVMLGGENFASPGTSDEKVFYAVAEVDPAQRVEPEGDGSVMEEAGGVVVLELGEALARCRSGEMCDMKTELALARLADHLGFVPALDLFVDELDDKWRANWRPRGLGDGQ